MKFFQALLVFVAFVGLIAQAAAARELFHSHSVENECDQIYSQISSLQTDENFYNTQAASISAGPKIPYESSWKPWPTHTWPYAGTKPAKVAQAKASQHQEQDDAQIAKLQAQLSSLGCPPASANGH